MKDYPKTLTYEHNYYRKKYPVEDPSFVVQQFNKGAITRDLAVRRLYTLGVQNPDSFLRGFSWELV